MRYSIIKFDTDRFDFISIIQDVLNEKDLSELNEIHSELFKVGDDSKTSFHKKFYDKYRSGWDEMQKLYDSFIKEVISPIVKEDFLYQRFPTFRVHLNGNLAVGDFHKDFDFGHPIGEINFIIPLTDSDYSASVWLESEPDKKDFVPIELKIGSLVQFNGNQLTHGNKVNTTGKSRVSMDFRVLPDSFYDENNSTTSITRNTKFKEGEYYKRYNK